MQWENAIGTLKYIKLISIACQNKLYQLFIAVSKYTHIHTHTCMETHTYINTHLLIDTSGIQSNKKGVPKCDSSHIIKYKGI